MISIYHDFSSDLKAVWDNLTSDSDSSPFLKFFLHKSWYELFGESKTLAVLNHSGDLLMPLVLDNQNAEMTGGQDLFDYHDFIYKKELDSKKVKEVIDYCFSDLEVKNLKFKSIVEESLTHKLIISSCNELGLRVSSSHEDLSPYLDLKNPFDDYLMNLNKKNRHEIRRKMKRLKSAGNILIKQCSKNEVSDWIEIFFKLMTQNPEKETFLNDKRKSFMKNIISNSIENQFGELNFLLINEKPVATTFFFKQKSKLSVYNSGYDSSFSSYSVGLMNHVYNISNYSGIISEIDFLRGSEDYKFRIGCISRNLLTLSVGD
ncbi:MAG: GNAT family N-acetyltransferase [Chloroflexota bacterium]|nr:GNAT family N-acetyltransferase [Chloroflexota bacterium]